MNSAHGPCACAARSRSNATSCSAWWRSRSIKSSASPSSGPRRPERRPLRPREHRENSPRSMNFARGSQETDFTINGPAGALNLGSPENDFMFPAPDVFYVRFIAGHNIQTLYAWTQVYIHIGLDNLKSSIDKVRKILGQAPSDPVALPSGLWWSLRETHNALGDVFPEPTPPLFQVTANETIGRLFALCGLSTGRPLSWRNALTAILLPIELRGAPNVPQ